MLLYTIETFLPDPTQGSTDQSPQPKCPLARSEGQVLIGSIKGEVKKKQTEVQVAGATLAVAPTQGPVGTRAMLRGEGFPRNTSLQLIWQTAVGSRVSGLGSEPQEKAVAQVKVGSDGRLEWPVTIPDDLGGLHTLALRSGDRLVARSFFVIETSIVSIRTGGHARDDSPQGRRLDRI